MKRLLVFRFSAMGDVAMTIPVLHALAKQYPELEITVVSRAAFHPLFEKLPATVSFIAADLQGKHKGIKGLFRLFRELHKQKFDAVADLHDVLRTKFLRWCFRLTGTKTARIDKGRKEKQKLTRPENKVFRPLKTSFIRYQEVFQKLGFQFPLHFSSIFEQAKADTGQIISVTGEKGNDTWIGIAPFAKHKGKIYPLPLMEQVIDGLSQQPDTNIFLFGGGKEETATLAAWEKKFPHTLALPGKLRMNGELVLMSQLDTMVSMDSANMHMASLTGTPVISIWGATHPYCGFSGWNQSSENTVQTDLSCRPCSVFGNKPCLRQDYACLYEIKPEEILQQIKTVLKRRKS